MNKAIILSGVLLSLLNILVGLIVTTFRPFNVAISTLVIISTTVMRLAVGKWIRMKDAFKVSLSLIIPAIGILQYLLAVFMPSHTEDNWCLAAILLLVAAEAILVFTSNNISNKIQ